MLILPLKTAVKGMSANVIYTPKCDEMIYPQDQLRKRQEIKRIS